MTQPFPAFWRRWLLVVIIGLIGFSLALIALPPTMQRFFDWILFAGDQARLTARRPVVDYVTFVYGILGAVMVGWSATLLYLVLGPLRRGEPGAWLALALSVTSWFVLDSAWSWWAGYPANVVFNLLFLVLFAVPLAATYRAARRAGARRTVAPDATRS
jgi:hypothetical protein